MQPLFVRFGNSFLNVNHIAFVEYDFSGPTGRHLEHAANVKVNVVMGEKSATITVPVEAWQEMLDKTGLQFQL